MIGGVAVKCFPMKLVMVAHDCLLRFEIDGISRSQRRDQEQY